MFVHLSIWRLIEQKFNSNFEEIGSWTAHEGTMLASAAGVFRDRRIYATGGNDNTVAIWDLTGHPETTEIQPIGNGAYIFFLIYTLILIIS